MDDFLDIEIPEKLPSQFDFLEQVAPQLLERAVKPLRRARAFNGVPCGTRSEQMAMLAAALSDAHNFCEYLNLWVGNWTEAFRVLASNETMPLSAFEDIVGQKVLMPVRDLFSLDKQWELCPTGPAVLCLFSDSEYYGNDPTKFLAEEVLIALPKTLRNILNRIQPEQKHLYTGPVIFNIEDTAATIYSLLALVKENVLKKRPDDALANLKGKIDITNFHDGYSDITRAEYLVYGIWNIEEFSRKNLQEIYSLLIQSAIQGRWFGNIFLEGLVSDRAYLGKNPDLKIFISSMVDEMNVCLNGGKMSINTLAEKIYVEMSGRRYRGFKYCLRMLQQYLEKKHSERETVGILVERIADFMAAFSIVTLGEGKGPRKGSREVELTPLGRFLANPHTDFPQFTAKPKTYYSLDPDYLIISCIGDANPYSREIKHFAKPLGRQRFAVNRESFLNGVDSLMAFKERIKEFNECFNDIEVPPVWISFIEEVQRYVTPASRVGLPQRYYTIKADSSEKRLMTLLQSDTELRKLFIFAEGGRIMVSENNYLQFSALLAGHNIFL